jgi:glycosyltransferase involved in cell wall biosynthesis
MTLQPTMRIAIVNWTNRKVGGAETYLEATIPALIGAGHEVFVWHETSNASGGERVHGVECASACASALGVEAAVRELEEWRPDVLFVHRLDDPAHERRLLDVAPAVFFAHDYYGTCISGTKTFGFPDVRPCDRRFGPACLARYLPRRCGGVSPLTMVRRYALQHTRLMLLPEYHAIATFSEHMRREYVNHGFDAQRVRVLPPIDPLQTVSSSAPNLGHRRRDVPGDAVRLAFIGRVDRLKGCDRLIQTLPLVAQTLARRVQLIVAGDGPDLAHCRAVADRVAAAEPNVSVRFTGWMSRDGCAALLDETAVLVVPSLWPEPLGFVGIESQQRGVPVAAYAVGGIPEWLEDGVTGALAPGGPPTIAGLAAAIVRCATSERIHAGVRERVVKGSSRFTIAHHLALLLPLLHEAATEPSREGLRH